MVPQNDSKILKRFKHHLIMFVRPHSCSRVNNVSAYCLKPTSGMTLKKGTPHESIGDLVKTVIPKIAMKALFLDYDINRRWLSKRFEYFLCTICSISGPYTPKHKQALFSGRTGRVIPRSIVTLE